MVKKKIVLSLTKIISAKNAINRILQLEGLPFKTSYWLGRNSDSLETVEKRFRLMVQKKFDDEAEEIIPYIVPSEKYEEFKREMLSIKSTDEIKSVFDKFEEKSKEPEKRIPANKMMKFNMEIAKIADETTEEIEYFPIQINADFEPALKLIEEKLPGSIINDIGFIFEGIEYHE
jgi:hypothetical protein